MNTEISPAQEPTFPRIEETSRKRRMRDITLEEVKAILHCDPLIGQVTNLVTRNPRAKAGTRAGTVRPDGYRLIRINGKVYLEHRLIWLFVHGVMPTNFLDHIDGNPSNNRIDNLREATYMQNNANQGKRCTSKSGHKGVSWNTRRKKWAAQISSNQRHVWLGYFTNIEDASAAYQAAALKYFGEFARQDSSLQPVAKVNPKD